MFIYTLIDVKDNLLIASFKNSEDANKARFLLGFLNKKEYKVEKTKLLEDASRYER